MILLLLVHYFYSAECCGGKDCHPVPCDEIVNDASGFRWQNIHFDRKLMRVSQDGECHVCVSNYEWATPTGPNGYGVCIYLPPRT